MQRKAQSAREDERPMVPPFFRGSPRFTSHRFRPNATAINTTGGSPLQRQPSTGRGQGWRSENYRPARKSFRYLSSYNHITPPRMIRPSNFVPCQRDPMAILAVIPNSRGAVTLTGT